MSINSKIIFRPAISLGVGFVIGSGFLVTSLSARALPQTAPPAAAAPDAPAPGPARRLMRNGRDPEAAKIPSTVVPTTIAAMGAIVRPTILPPDARVKPLEMTVWSIQADLTASSSKPDGDYFLVLRDADGKTLTAELPDPEKVKDSAWLKNIIAARKAFGTFLADSAKADRSKPIHVRVSGLGYFGRLNSDEADGAGLKNGVQLHPVTDFVVLP